MTRPTGNVTRAAGRTITHLRGALKPYGMLGVLLLLCAFFAVLTLREQHPVGESAAKTLVRQVGAYETDRPVIIVARSNAEDARFADSMDRRLRDQGRTGVAVILGDPADLRRLLRPSSLDSIRARFPSPSKPPLLVCLEGYAPVLRAVLADFSDPAPMDLLTPTPYRWPTFLLPENLLNVANQIAVIAILAIGMTMVIVAGGIDLSVGSLIALAAVVTAGLIGRLGGEAASFAGMTAAASAAILLCAGIGAFSGLVITRFQVPPFIATLGMMQVASGLAYILSHGKPVYRIPEGFVTLGRGVDPMLGVPYAVWLMTGLYIGAHLLMSRTILGRYIYAVGGNAEAARLAGVRVRGVVMFVFVVCGGLAGLGGVVMASQLKSGAPTYGLMYELYVIAAVVVGGTSLSGGEGRILGTLIGAFIIAVIQNGMNLTNVESYTQKVVLGLVILGAVLLDRLKHQGWFWQRRPAAARE